MTLKYMISVEQPSNSKQLDELNQDRALAKIDEEFHFLKKNHMVSIGMNFKFMSLIVLN